MQTYSRSSRIVALFFLLVVFSGTFAALALEAAVKVRVGVYQNEPKIFFNSRQQADGLFVKLLSRVAEQENWQIEYVKGSWADCLRRLAGNEIEILPDIAWSQERAQRFLLNQEPVSSDWLQIIARPEVKIDTLTDMEGKKIAVLAGSIQSELLQQHLSSFDMKSEVIAVNDVEQVFREVAEGRAHLLISNRFTGRLFAEKYRLQETPAIFHPTRLHFATSSQANLNLLDAIDKNLRIWKRDHNSVYYQILNEYLSNEKHKIMAPWLKTAISILIVLVLSALTLVLIFRRQLNQRTLELQNRNLQLSKILLELQTAHNKAAEHEKMNVLGQMVSGVAHDLNNILMPIIALPQLLLDRDDYLASPSHVKKYLQLICAAGKDGSEIVKRMRNFYRRQDFFASSSSININELITSAVELTRPVWEGQNKKGTRAISLEFFPGQISHLFGNETSLREVMINLILNAVDALHDGGNIKIATCSLNDEIHVTISDNGCGMPPEVMASCFKAFYTTKGEKGTGMGLCIAKEVCDAHGASITVESMPGLGTTFTLRFPEFKDIPEKVVEAEQCQTGRQLKILLVDDNPNVLEVSRLMLCADGHEVHCESNPEAAVKIAISEHFDLLISDYSMPVLTGDEVVKEIRRFKPTMPAIILSGSHFTSIPDLNDRQLDFFLEKPVKAKQFREILARFTQPGPQDAV